MAELKPQKLTIYFIIVVLLVLCGVVTYCIQTKSHFDKTCERIILEHDKLCEQFPAVATLSHKDSVIVIDANILIQVESGNNKVKDMLALQHSEVQEDFSILMLWASVLMVVFLVFSIYSMYRVDDLVNQGRNSVSTITDLSEKAHDKIGEVNQLFDKESKRLDEQSKAEIQKLKDAQTEQMRVLEEGIQAKIDEYSKQITTKAENFNKEVSAKSEEVIKLVETIKKSTEPFAQLLGAIIDSNSKKDKETPSSKGDTAE